MADLAGKVALVTGGSRGIGAAVAKRLAKDGANVAFTYARAADRAKEVVRAIEKLGREALAIAADSADPESGEAAVTATLARFGRLDILVNNAGIYEMGTIDRLTRDDFERTVSTNLRGPFLASSAAARNMADGGSILSIGSTFATHVPLEGLSLYSLSKAALIGMTKGMARDLGPRGITVNVVHPGPTATEMNPDDGPDADAQRAGILLRRFSQPDEVAGLVAWLAGPDGRNVTGGEFTIDGGSTV
ncbi:MAG TPA: 3-oxoacyl-ACP reductase family protein [Rhizobiaceae bacterium]|nr:3-oxoacyl-ACP reductase family protein [Rhizobiaceae bacterium]